MREISIEVLKRIISETIAEFERIPYVPVMVSNRHIHLSKEDMEALFGKGHSLTPTRELLPGQFACEETLDVIGKTGALKKVRVLAPLRKATQLEISVTDNFAIGVRTPLNESGNLKGAGLVTLENPKNSARIERECAITAQRHIHIRPEFAEKHALKDGQTVSVEVESRRGVVFRDVLIRISKDFKEEMHIDTDEANAGMIKNGNLGRILDYGAEPAQASAQASAQADSHASKQADSHAKSQACAQSPAQASGARRRYEGNVLSRGELMGAAGCGEIAVGPDCVVTMLAAETARKMGITIVRRTN